MNKLIIAALCICMISAFTHMPIKRHQQTAAGIKGLHASALEGKSLPEIKINNY